MKLDATIIAAGIQGDSGRANPRPRDQKTGDVYKVLPPTLISTSTW